MCQVIENKKSFIISLGQENGKIIDYVKIGHQSLIHNDKFDNKGYGKKLCFASSGAHYTKRDDYNN